MPSADLRAGGNERLDEVVVKDSSYLRMVKGAAKLGEREYR